MYNVSKGRFCKKKFYCSTRQLAIEGLLSLYGMGNDMEYDKNKVDEVVLALLYLNFHGDRDVVRAWKSFDWDAMDRLFEKGFISAPKSKAKSVIMTEEGQKVAQELFKKHFCT
jgi:hypothetical protein